MKFTPTLKTLTLLGLASLTLAAPSSQADGGFIFSAFRAPTPG